MATQKEILEATYDNLVTLDNLCEQVEKLHNLDNIANSEKEKNEILDISLSIVRALNKHLKANNQLVRIIRKDIGIKQENGHKS